mmetsp:Transcript_19549/g.55630  ORF Transcript_19549/g.55630 Transcript_19549/m.55630 type:complete len:222 (+) Transcript_19549:345-1010(+)
MTRNWCRRTPCSFRRSNPRRTHSRGPAPLPPPARPAAATMRDLRDTREIRRRPASRALCARGCENHRQLRRWVARPRRSPPARSCGTTCARLRHLWAPWLWCCAASLPGGRRQRRRGSLHDPASEWCCAASPPRFRAARTRQDRHRQRRCLPPSARRRRQFWPARARDPSAAGRSHSSRAWTTETSSWTWSACRPSARTAWPQLGRRASTPRLPQRGGGGR